jgi:hypothetical protein
MKSSVKNHAVRLRVLRAEKVKAFQGCQPTPHAAELAAIDAEIDRIEREEVGNERAL